MGWNVSLPKYIHWNPNSQHLWMWPYLGTGSLQLIKLRWGHQGGGLVLCDGCPYNKGEIGHRRHRGKAMWRDIVRMQCRSQGRGLPEAGRPRKDPSPLGFRGSVAAETLILDFQPPELQDNKFLSHWFVALCYCGLTTLTQMWPYFGQWHSKESWLGKIFPTMQSNSKETLIFLMMTLWHLQVMVGTAAAILWTWDEADRINPQRKKEIE